MNDAFLPGNGFDTYEEQDRVLMGLSGSVRSGVAVRILQQQGFAVAAAVVRLADTPEEHAAVDAAKALAKKLDVECVTLNAETLAGQDAEAARLAAPPSAAVPDWNAAFRLISTKAAADAGSSSASTAEYHAERNVPFTYQEATFGISPSSTMLLLLPTAAARESL